MPVPDPIRDRVAGGAPRLNLAKITGGMQPSEIRFEVDRGARFVVYQYSISVLVMSFRRNSDVQFVRANESRAVKSLPWTVISLFLGWWGIPWGFIYTPQVIYRNLQGGADITPVVLGRLNPNS